MRWIPWVMLPWIAWADPGDFVEEDGQVLWYDIAGGSAQLGWVTTGLEDIDGDGAKEVIAGAPTAIGGGYTVVYSGATGQELYHFSELSGAHGTAVADAGDVDNDGVHDIMASAPGLNQGHVYIYSGATGTLTGRCCGPGPAPRPARTSGSTPRASATWTATAASTSSPRAPPAAGCTCCAGPRQGSIRAPRTKSRPGAAAPRHRPRARPGRYCSSPSPPGGSRPSSHTAAAPTVDSPRSTVPLA